MGAKTFHLTREYFWNFQPEILPKWKGPLITPLIIATRGLLQRSPHACTCMRRSQWGSPSAVKKGQLFFTVSHHKCRLVLTVKKFQGISNLAFFLVFQLIFMDLWLLNNLQTGKPVPTFSKHSFKTLQHLSTCLYLKIFRNFTSKRPRQPPTHNC